MDVGSLLSDLKWDILQYISMRKASPLQLAEALNTSMSNVSQQLRMLEFSGIVTKEKLPNTEKGKPRSMFSLSRDYAYLVSLMQGFTKKKLLRLTPRQKYFLRALFLDNEELQYFIEKFYWTVEKHFNNIDVLGFSFGKDVTVYVGSQKKDALKSKLTQFTLTNAEGQEKMFKCKVLTLQEFRKLGEKDVTIFYDPKEMCVFGVGGDAPKRH